MSYLADYEDENVLVTGISGFVGANVARTLATHDANVYGFNRRKATESDPRNLVELGIREEIELLQGDLLDMSAVLQAIRQSEPDHVFHLGAQSFVPFSFDNPEETIRVNQIGTLNLLEAVRLSDLAPSIVLAGTSEEYGLVIGSRKQYDRVSEKKNVVPEPESIPELPISEANPLRPQSPYAASKVSAEYLVRNYYQTYGLDTKVSRGFNHEGARRGQSFVTSVIAKQVADLTRNEEKKIQIGNVNAFRDWSHVDDIVRGYALLSKRGAGGEVYNQGSNRMNSVLGYILLSLEAVGYSISNLRSLKNGKEISNPTERRNSAVFGVEFERTKASDLILQGEIRFELNDEGIVVETDGTDILIEFDEERFRPSEVPMLLADTSKIANIGFEIQRSLSDIIRDQLAYHDAKEVC